MSKIISVPAQERQDEGKGASRRLRRAGLVPAVVYGANRDPRSISIDHNFLYHAAEDELFYSSILELQVEDGRKQRVVLRDLQRHPVRIQILHADFQRIKDDEELRMTVPLHFIGESESPAGKISGVVISHVQSDVEVSALPENLPEFIEVDLSELEVGDVITLSNLKVPEGVSLTALSHGDDSDFDTAVASAAYVAGSSTSDDSEEAAEDEAETGDDES